MMVHYLTGRSVNLSPNFGLLRYGVWSWDSGYSSLLVLHSPSGAMFSISPAAWAHGQLLSNSAAPTFSAWKSNSLSGTFLCFMIGFQRQQSTKILHQIEISTVRKEYSYAEEWLMAENQPTLREETRVFDAEFPFKDWIICLFLSCWVTFKSLFFPHTKTFAI